MEKRTPRAIITALILFSSLHPINMASAKNKENKPIKNTENYIGIAYPSQEIFPEKKQISVNEIIKLYIKETKKQEKEYINSGYIVVSKKNKNIKKYIPKKSQKEFTDQKEFNKIAIIYNPKKIIKNPNTYFFLLTTEKNEKFKNIKTIKSYNIIIKNRCIKTNINEITSKKNLYLSEYVDYFEKKQNEIYAIYSYQDGRRDYLTIKTEKNKCLSEIDVLEN